MFSKLPTVQLAALASGALSLGACAMEIGQEPFEEDSDAAILEPDVASSSSALTVPYPREAFDEALDPDMFDVEADLTPPGQDPTPLSFAPNGAISFERDCQVSGDNAGCRKRVYCPANYRIASVRAACNLEWGSVSSADVQSLPHNTLSIVRETDRSTRGSAYCAVSGRSKSKGSTSLGHAVGYQGVEIFCKEHDKNGGDCHVKASLSCEEGSARGDLPPKSNTQSAPVCTSPYYQYEGWDSDDAQKTYERCKNAQYKGRGWCDAVMVRENQWNYVVTCSPAAGSSHGGGIRPDPGPGNPLLPTEPGHI